jgi:hypothetical protein
LAWSPSLAKISKWSPPKRDCGGANAVRAAYEALAAAISGLLPEERSGGHAALVAAIYRELIPAGRIAAAAPTSLARL